MMCSNPKDLKPDDTPTADLGVVEPQQTNGESQQQVHEAAKEDGE